VSTIAVESISTYRRRPSADWRRLPARVRKLRRDWPDLRLAEIVSPSQIDQTTLRHRVGGYESASR
jgi:hypothetical protein